MAEAKCQRCSQIKLHGITDGMCSPCCVELSSLKEGDAVEWWHHTGSWRPAIFVRHNLGARTSVLRTPVGCEVYRKQILIRVPGGRVTPSRRSDK